VDPGQGHHHILDRFGPGVDQQLDSHVVIDARGDLLAKTIDKADISLLLQLPDHEDVVGIPGIGRYVDVRL